MKYCEEYAALLDLFVDGELPPEDMARVRDHLETCPGCRSYVDDALAIRAGFPSAEDTAVPEDFTEGVMELVRRDAKRKRMAAEQRRGARRRWMGTLTALAACCALVILVRTGPGNFKEEAGDVTADTAAAVTRGAAPSGAPTEAADDSAEDGAAPQMAAAPSEALEAAASKEESEDRQPEPRMAASDSENAKVFGEEENGPASSYEKAVSLSPPAPEAAFDENREAALYLTAEEAGDLLDGFDVVWENAVEWRYELNAQEYQALLTALGRQEELPEAAEGSFLVVVTGSVE